ncbi:MAG TPA: HAD family hydrolase [Polyangiales bacterium]|nr:HAD family hydrolase [Polyangiales bacterium]
MHPFILLDIDGTLVDSNGLHAESWQAALAQYGVESDLATLRRLIGKGSDKLLPEATGISAESDLGARITETRGKLFMRDFLPRVQPFPSSRVFVERILALGLKPVVASSANARELEALLEVAQVKDLLPLKTGADDADSSKPDPDIVQAALKRASAKPKDAVLVGDTPYDLEAATRAGVEFIGVRSGGWGDADLKGAIAIYDDVSELAARL